MENKSTILATNEIAALIEKGFKQKKMTLAVLLDTAGAFENAWYIAIINGLLKRNSPEYLLLIIKSFLSKRKATIVQDNASHTVTLSKGCPQESILSPFLWNIIFDQVLKIPLQPGIHIQAFADDLIVYCSDCRQQTMISKIQDTRNKLHQWCILNKLSLST